MTLSPRRTAATLSAVAGTLVLVHVGLQVWHYEVQPVDWLIRQLFDVDDENNLPTWYSSTALLGAALLLYATAREAGRTPWPGHWRVLAIGFALMSLDEVAGLHESLNSATSVSWALPAVPVVALIGLAYVPFLAQLPRRTAVLFILAGAMFVGGAVGLELMTEPYAEADQLDTLAYNLWTAVEEGLEMAGVVLFIYAQLGYMSAGPAIEIRIDAR